MHIKRGVSSLWSIIRLQQTQSWQYFHSHGPGKKIWPLLNSHCVASSLSRLEKSCGIPRPSLSKKINFSTSSEGSQCTVTCFPLISTPWTNYRQPYWHSTKFLSARGRHCQNIWFYTPPHKMLSESRLIGDRVPVKWCAWTGTRFVRIAKAWRNVWIRCQSAQVWQRRSSIQD